MLLRPYIVRQLNQSLSAVIGFRVVHKSSAMESLFLLVHIDSRKRCNGSQIYEF